MRILVAACRPRVILASAPASRLRAPNGVCRRGRALDFSG
jgi:hypothetical protein